MSKHKVSGWTYPTILYGNNPYMSKVTRRILADNIIRMIDRDGHGVRGKVRGWATANKLDTRQIDRIVKQEFATTVDTLEEIAAAIGCQPWQLLVPGMNLHELPMLVMSPAEREIYERIQALLSKVKEK